MAGRPPGPLSLGSETGRGPPGFFLEPLFPGLPPIPDSKEQSQPQIAQEKCVPGLSPGRPGGFSKSPALKGSCHFIFLSVFSKANSLRPVTSNMGSQSEREIGCRGCNPEVVGPRHCFQSLQSKLRREFSTGGILTVQDWRRSGTYQGWERSSMEIRPEPAPPTPSSGPY